MISSIDPSSLSSQAPVEPVKNVAPSGGFNAALEAARKEAAREEANSKMMATIREKGFSDWVRDTQIEKLKEELRKKVMQAMGLTEDQLTKMAPAIQQILEQKIQEEVEKQLQEIMAKEQGGQPQSTVATASQPAGKNDPGGKKCPVIPALVWPGGASVL